MIIHKNFVGGNIKIVSQDENTVYVENEMRDTNKGVDWFYWAFCVEGAQGQTVTFRFQKNRLGYFGPAVSHDLKTWKWLGSCGENEFTYTFGINETKVYFAHDMLYHPDRFFAFAAEKGLTLQEFCKSKRGRPVPCFTIGKGKRKVILSARHHACEATGNYVLEGMLDEWLKAPIADTEILCVPFVDLDGVLDGDQGKERAPFDHNRDYRMEEPSIYPETAKIREYVEKNGCQYGFDFHSPWHIGGSNDHAFIVHKLFTKTDRLRAFGSLLEEEITPTSFAYQTKDDLPFMEEWNFPSTCFNTYMISRKGNEVAFSFETSYYGTPENPISQDNMVELGRCFARAFKRYVQEKEGRIPLSQA